MNEILPKLFCTKHSVRQGCLLLSTCLVKSNVITRDLGCGKLVSAFANDITTILTAIGHLQRVYEAIKDYETVLEANINRE